jgi:hypothetical protein
MEKKLRKQKKIVINDPLVVSMSTQKPAQNDPNGSYTGIPINKEEVPVQDADDL